MDLHIRPLCESDVEDVVQLSLLAWEPVFESFERILGSRIFPLIYPDWRKSQREGIEFTCSRRDGMPVWVAEREGAVVGFIAYEFHADDTAEVQLLAVHPDHQNLGIGTALNEFALEKMKAGGAKYAVVGSGGDPGHAPARRSYEKAGYTGLPLVRYYKYL